MSVIGQTDNEVTQGAEICDNGFDDDGDLLIDTEDTDCANSIPKQLPAAEEVCDNGVDDNGDGAIDEGCAPPPPPEEVCGNAVDDDNDGSVDEGCASPPPPPPTCGTDEHLENGMCVANPPPPPPTCGTDEHLENGMCVANPPPPPPPAEEICGDGIDNTGDGQIDEGCAAPRTSQEQPLQEQPPKLNETVPPKLNETPPTAPLEVPPTGNETPPTAPLEVPPTGNETPPTAPLEVPPTGNETPPTAPLEVPPTGKARQVESTDCPNNATITHCLPPNDVSLHEFQQNIAPIADAGENQLVKEDSSVILDGTKSNDKDGNITLYSWVQTGGNESVTISQADTPNPSFYVPNVASDLSLTFELTVFDDMGYATNDDVTVLVKNADGSAPLPLNGSISLDPIPRTLNEGTNYVFKGQLNLERVPDSGRYVEIIDESGGSKDVLSFGTTDKNGVFIAEWITQSREMDYNIYALYKDEYGTLLKSVPYPLTVIPSQAILENLSEIVTSRPYIPIEFNDYRNDKINAYIVYEDEASKQYVPVATKAVKHWEQALKRMSGNPQAWNIEIHTSGGTPDSHQFGLYPMNILVNLKQDDKMKYCKDGIGGIAHTFFNQRLFKSTISTHVYTSCGSKSNTDSQIQRITSHEFGHALGLGHTRNEGDQKKGTADMMCSSEVSNRFIRWLQQMIPNYYVPRSFYSGTCVSTTDFYKDTNYPSDFDIGAVIYAYGRDGFASPNTRLFADTVYTCEKEPKLCQPSSKQDKANNAISSDDKTASPYRLIVYLDGATKTNAIGDNFKIVVYNSNHNIILSEKPTIDFTDTHQKISPKSGYTIQGKSGEHPNQISVCAQQEYELEGKKHVHDDCYPIKQNIQKTYWYTIFDYGEIDGFEGDTQDKSDKIVANKNIAKNQVQSMGETHKQPTHFSADLVGEAEVTPIFSESYGTALVDGNDINLKYQINVTSLDKVTGAFLYKGDSTENGQVLVSLLNLTKPSGVIDGKLVEGTINSSSILAPLANLTSNLTSTMSSSNLTGNLTSNASSAVPANKLLALIDLMNQNMTYVNIHTSKFPDGELRGQLISSIK
jgi:hypothetical protein